jgi:hypothetical protein
MNSAYTKMAVSVYDAAGLKCELLVRMRAACPTLGTASAVELYLVHYKRFTCLQCSRKCSVAVQYTAVG